MTCRAVADGVWSVTAGEYPSNSYICAVDAPGGAVLVDAGLDADAIEAGLSELGLTPAAVFCTHGHFDHIGSAAHFQDRYGARVVLHRDDVATTRKNNFLLLAMKLAARVRAPSFDLVDDGASFDLGGRTLRFRHTPGHTPGSCAISLGEHLFTGDTLYARGIGLSQLPGERPDRLADSVRALWPTLDRYHVHPGHGESATGAAIKAGNVRLRRFIGLEEQQEVMS